MSAKGHLSGADDSVHVWNSCLAAWVCVHFHSDVLGQCGTCVVFCVTVYTPCVGYARQRVGSADNYVALPILPSGDEDAPACHCHHGYCWKRGADIACLVNSCAIKEPSQQQLFFLLYYVNRSSVGVRTLFNSKGPIMAITTSYLKHFIMLFRELPNVLFSFPYDCEILQVSILT